MKKFLSLIPLSLLVLGLGACSSSGAPRGETCRYRGIIQRDTDHIGSGHYRCRRDGEAAGLVARVMQHETDHLDGILYPMRIVDFTQFGFTEVMFPDLDPNDDD